MVSRNRHSPSHTSSMLRACSAAATQIASLRQRRPPAPGTVGDLLQRRLHHAAGGDHIRSGVAFSQLSYWVSDLPGAVVVAYETGRPASYLYRHLTAAGIGCEVAASGLPIGEVDAA